MLFKPPRDLRSSKPSIRERINLTRQRIHSRIITIITQIRTTSPNPTTKPNPLTKTNTLNTPTTTTPNHTSQSSTNHKPLPNPATDSKPERIDP